MYQYLFINVGWSFLPWDIVESSNQNLNMWLLEILEGSTTKKSWLHVEIYTHGTIQFYELGQQVEAVILYRIETIFVVHKFEVSNDSMLLVFLYLVSTLLSKLFPLIFFL